MCYRARSRACVRVRARGVVVCAPCGCVRVWCGWVWVCGCPPPWSPGWEGGWGACCFCVVVLWRCPTLPRPVDRSTIGVTGLSFQVRNVAGRFPGAMTTTNFVSNLTDPARHQRSRACVGVRGGVVDRGLHSGCEQFAYVCPTRAPAPPFFLVFQSCFLVFQVGVGVWGFV